MLSLDFTASVHKSALNIELLVSMMLCSSLQCYEASWSSLTLKTYKLINAEPSLEPVSLGFKFHFIFFDTKATV